MLPTINLLACVDGSQWAIQALTHLVRSLGSSDQLTLLYVAPRAGDGYLECGRMILEAALHHCRMGSGDARVRCRLEIGDPASCILKVCREERPDVIAMGSNGADGYPYLSELGEVVRAVWLGCARPVLLASPRGTELLVAEERILTVPRMPKWRPSAPIPHAPSRGLVLSRTSSAPR